MAGTWSLPGGGTKTTWEGNLLQGVDNAHIITTPSVAIGTEKDISVEIKHLTNNAGFSASVYVDMLTSRNNDTYWDIPNLNVNSATWIDEAGDTGHFSVAPGTDVKLHCKTKINGTEYQIIALVGDGTGAGAVTLNGNPGGDFAITWIRGMEYINGISIVAQGAGTDAPVGTWYTARSKTTNRLSANAKKLGELLAAPTQTTGEMGGGEIKMSILKDGVLYYHNGTIWTTMLTTEYATKGLYYDSGWKAADGTDMADLWATFDANCSDHDIDIEVACKATVSTDYAYLQAFTLNMTERNLYWGVPTDSGMNVENVNHKRLSATEVMIQNDTGGNLTDLYVTITTP